MTNNEINVKLADVLGYTVTDASGSIVLGYIKRPGDNIINISGPINFVCDWNKIMELIKQLKFQVFVDPMENSVSIEDKATPGLASSFTLDKDGITDMLKHIIEVRQLI